MKKIRITADCFIKGEPHSVGDVIELDPVSAAEALASGRCELAETFAKRGQAEDIETRDPEATDRDPKPARKRAKAAPQPDQAPAPEGVPGA